MDGISGDEGGDAASPNFFVGQYTEDQVAERLGMLDGFGQHIEAVEGRFNESLSPLAERLQELEKSLGSRQSVQVPAELIAEIDAHFSKWDPKLGEGVGALFQRLLTESVKSAPLDENALRPYIEPMLREQEYKTETAWLEAIEPHLGFQIEDLHQDGELKKEFYGWLRLQPRSVHEAVTAARPDGYVAHPRAFGKVMQSFDKARKQKLKSESDNATASSARLSGARQTSSSATGSPSRKQSSDPFADGFNEVLRELRGE